MGFASAATLCCWIQRLLRDGSLPLRVFAYDARGHGATVCADEKNLSAEILTEDGIAIVNFLFNRLIREELPQRTDMQKGPVQDGTARAEPKVHRDPDSLPSVILVGHRFAQLAAAKATSSGHGVSSLRNCDDVVSALSMYSMGGAIATRMAASGRVPHLDGLMVLDVVEGTRFYLAEMCSPCSAERPVIAPLCTSGRQAT